MKHTLTLGGKEHSVEFQITVEYDEDSLYLDSVEVTSFNAVPRRGNRGWFLLLDDWVQAELVKDPEGLDEMLVAQASWSNEPDYELRAAHRYAGRC